ncbi:MAG TPA: ribosomal L7Ae/L30e/S12e/Gadd45 family protein [Candidatus Nanoarchaeia archaeon]|nr:ribosomal L7Ae/L30e/S12e/Gadd45 family protein [Candidatus Nanoarchaeia archaeon]
MAKTLDDMTEFKKLLAAKKLILGTKETMKKLRAGKIGKIFLASNCDQSVRADIQRVCSLGNVQCVDLSQSNDEIGVLCKKQFAISVVGVA